MEVLHELGWRQTEVKSETLSQSDSIVVLSLGWAQLQRSGFSLFGFGVAIIVMRHKV